MLGLSFFRVSLAFSNVAELRSTQHPCFLRAYLSIYSTHRVVTTFAALSWLRVREWASLRRSEIP